MNSAHKPLRCHGPARLHGHVDCMVSGCPREQFDSTLHGHPPVLATQPFPSLAPGGLPLFDPAQIGRATNWKVRPSSTKFLCPWGALPSSSMGQRRTADCGSEMWVGSKGERGWGLKRGTQV